MFEDNFDTGGLPVWTFGRGWSVVPSESGQALQAFDTEEVTTLSNGNLFDVAVQVRSYFVSGGLILFARESEIGGYAVTLDTSGNATLYRAGTPFASGITSTSLPDQWRTIYLSVVNNLIRVVVDDVEVIAMIDNAPLPPGKIGFASIQLEEQPLFIDDVQIWLSSNELPLPTLTPTAAPPMGASVQTISEISYPHNHPARTLYDSAYYAGGGEYLGNYGTPSERDVVQPLEGFYCLTQIRIRYRVQVTVADRVYLDVLVNNAVVASWFATGSVRLYEQIINLPVHTWASSVTVRVRKQASSASGTAQIGYFNVRHSVPCNVPEPTSTPTPTMTPTATATPTPLQLAYYERFKGLIFWIIYNETSENSMVERFDIVENAINNSDPNDPNRVISVPDLAAYTGEERENLHLPYLFARVILDHVPTYEEIAGNESQGFVEGFDYGRNWGGSINNPGNDIWINYRGCSDTHGYAAELSAYQSVHSMGGVHALDWLSDYINCRTIVSSEYLDAYQQLTPYIDQAIEHHITNVPNPVAHTEYIRNANSCFWFRPDGGCAYVKEVPQLCTAEGMNCHALGMFTEGVLVAPISSDVFNTWQTNYSQLPEGYRAQGTQSYLFSTENRTDNIAVEQITYVTQVGMQYSVSVGLRGEGTEARYILMGVGTNQTYGVESIEQTFLRHWGRMNRDRNPDNSPETYRPNFCLTGMIHATFGTSIFEQWVSFTFQSQESVNPAYDIWFCEG